MSFDVNKKIIANLIKGNKEIYLIDSSAFCRFEEVDYFSTFSFLEYLKNNKKIYFLMTNEVLTEIANGPRNLNFSFFLEHIINAEGSFASRDKENRFIIKNGEELSYVVLNKVSGQDYNQVLLAQNHLELKIVTNDRKLLKSARAVIGDRVITPIKLIDRAIELDPRNIDLDKYKKITLKIFKVKS